MALTTLISGNSDSEKVAYFSEKFKDIGIVLI